MRSRSPDMPHSRTQRGVNSRRSSNICRAKSLLFRDIRPTPNPQTQFLLRRADLCPYRCIYCDIWKLALLVSSRQSTCSPCSSFSACSSPSSISRQSSINTPKSPRFPQSPTPNSPSPAIITSDYERSLKAIESAHTVQRARLNSIISICRVEGAEGSEGLRVAHDRCLGAVLELMRQERALLRWIAWQEDEEQARERERDADRDCGHGSRIANHSEGGIFGRNNAVTCAT